MTLPLLIHAGPILTMDPAHPEVEAVLVDQGKVVATGSTNDLRSLRGLVQEFNLEGRFATPGLYDAHAHIMGIGFVQNEIDVSPDSVDSINDIVRLIAEAAASRPVGTWIVAQGYDQASLTEQRHPLATDLDAVAPDHPVMIWRTCHHILVANSAALRLAEIDRNTPDSSDGTIDRDEHGNPTGVLRESMATLLADIQPPDTEDEIMDALERGGQECWRNGITSAAEAGIRTREEFQAYQRLWQAGKLPLRTWLMMIIDDTLDELISLGITTGFGDDHLRIGNAKLFSDGSIGGRTARMREPYLDEPENYGIWMISPEEIKAKVLRAHQAGFQIGIHAIGDAAIDVVIAAYEEAQAATPRTDTRHRIEHCSLPALGMLHRIRKLGAIPIPGTTFLHYTRSSYLQNVGEERIRYAYAMKTFEEMGIVAAASSDAPVVPVNPLLGIQTMVSRRDRLGREIYPEERISVEEAIRAYTINAAWASFDEHRKGKLAPGYLADITVFEQDLRTIEPDELSTVKVETTLMDGEVVWDRAVS